MEHAIDKWIGAASVVIVPICFAEEGAEPESEALNLPVVPILSYGHELRVMNR